MSADGLIEQLWGKETYPELEKVKREAKEGTCGECGEPMDRPHDSGLCAACWFSAQEVVNA